MCLMENNPEIPQSKVVEKHKRLVEIIGKKRMRAIAAFSIAAAGLLGLSGKLESGVGGAVEVTNPSTGKQESVGVSISSSTSSSTDEIPLGFPKEILEKMPMSEMEFWQVNIGGARFTVFKTELRPEGGLGRGGIPPTRTVLGFYAGAETNRMPGGYR